MTATGPLADKISAKWLILFGEIMMFTGTMLFPFAGDRSHYWSLVFPGFVIGSAGTMLTFVHTK